MTTRNAMCRIAGCLLLVVGAVWGLAGCGGNAAVAPPATAVASAERLSLIGALSTPAQVTLQGVAPAAPLTQAFAARPEFTATGVGEGCVWGRLKDGTLHAVCTSRPPANEPPLMGTEQADPSGNVIPFSRDAYLLNTLGTGFTNPLPSLNRWLTSAGWRIRGTDPSVTGFSRMTNPTGVLFVNTHGAVVAGVSVLWTGTEVTAANLPTYQPLLNDGSLITMTAAATSTTTATHYALTPKYIRDHLNLGGQGVVFLNASSLNRADMREAFADAHANCFLGWSGPVRDADATNAARYFFSRLLGGTNGPSRVDPPQRPFDMIQIMEEMRRLRWDVSPRTGDVLAALRLTHLGEEAYDTVVTRLAPSIETLIMDDNGLLRIYGEFPPDPGGSARRVTVNGAAVPIRSWSRSGIDCQLPHTGSGSAGDVIVYYRSRRSNAVPLTRWNMRFRQVCTHNGTLRETINMTPQFRGDVHLSRERLADPATPPAQEVARPAPMRSGGWTATGSYMDGTTEHWQSDGGVLDTTINPAGSPPGTLVTELTILGPTREMSASLYLAGNPTYQYHTRPAGGSDTFVNLPLMIAPQFHPTAIALSVNSDWSINPGSVQFTDWTGAWKLEWWSCVPEFAPAANTLASLWSALEVWRGG